MAAAADQDHPPLERWAGMRDAENGVVWDAHIGGWPVCLLGFESRPVKRIGFVATDGPENWTSGTLFPLASKKIARAINAASGNRPLVVLANLSGFDGSPESMRKVQLEYGAEIGRAVTNFQGPIVFTVVSRYHGGAFVVFSKTLNDNMEVAALEGTYASVIGGAPAAAVVFAREVDQRTKKDPRIVALEKEIAAAPDARKRKLRKSLAELVKAVRSEKLGQVADEFDGIHSVQRALAVGSLDRILPAAELRPYLVDAIETGHGEGAGTNRPLTLVSWLAARQEELPRGEAWLTEAEREVLSRLRVPKRRGDWLLGRWVAKRALVLAGEAETGRATSPSSRPPPAPPRRSSSAAPPASRSPSRTATASPSRRSGRPASASASTSRRSRSAPAGFLGDWFTPAEQAFVAGAGAGEAALAATLVWSAKESVMKALREGLRIPPKAVEVAPRPRPGRRALAPLRRARTRRRTPGRAGGGRRRASSSASWRAPPPDRPGRSGRLPRTWDSSDRKRRRAPKASGPPSPTKRSGRRPPRPRPGRERRQR